MGLATAICGALLLGSPTVSTAADGELPTTPAGLETALARDLQLSPAEFDALGELARIASEALPELKQIDGFAGISISEEEPATLLIAGAGVELQRAVAELDAKEDLNAKLVAPPSPAEQGDPSPDATAGTSSTARPTAPPTAQATESAPDVPTSDADQEGASEEDTEAHPGDTTSSEATDTSSPGTAAEPSAVPEPATTEPTDTTRNPESAASAPDTPPKAATSALALLNDYIDAYGKGAVSRLQSIMRNADGGFVVHMAAHPQRMRATGAGSAPAPGPSASEEPVSEPRAPQSFADKYTNVNIAQADGPAEPRMQKRPAPQDYGVAGGLGTLTQNAEYVSVCSIGFNAYSPSGEPAALSAGHCTMDGQFKDVFLTDPTKDRAAEPGASDPDTKLVLQIPEVLTELGTYTFSRFGGAEKHSGIPAENTPATDGGTDVAVISNISDELQQLPAVTDWTTPTDPAASGPLVTGQTQPVIGAPVCKSGRTTGWTCGTIDATGVFMVAGPDYPMDEKDIRVVQGFGSYDLYSATGDSGGPMITGNQALGVLSAGGGSTQGSLTTFGASISPMLKAAKGYTLQVFVRAPQLRSHDDGGTARTGERVYGTSPAGSEVTVTSGGKRLNVTVTPEGRWSFRAPDEAGVFTFSVVASKGFSTSETSKYRLIVEQPPPPPAKEKPEPDVVPAGGEPPAPLADTGVGADPMSFGLFGGGLLAAGVALLLTSRRRAVVDTRSRP